MKTINYEHDASGRLKKITYNNGAAVEYFYDDVGNRTFVAQSAGCNCNFPIDIIILKKLNVSRF